MTKSCRYKIKSDSSQKINTAKSLKNQNLLQFQEFNCELVLVGPLNLNSEKYKDLK